MPIRKTKTQPQKKTRQKDTIYPILKECSLLVKDEFWRQFYEDLSAGKSTKGIYISNGIIQTSNKRNGFFYSITDKAPQVIVKELHHLLTTHTSICSKKDLNKKRIIVQEIEEELSAYDKTEWTGVKRKNVRILLLVDYAVKLNEMYNLTWPDTINAYKVILNSFESKTHNSKDVIYYNGKIKDIKDIEFSDGQIVNTRSIKIDEVQDKTADNKMILLQSIFENYINTWLKYIKS